jgi:hypothetical protein
MPHTHMHTSRLIAPATALIAVLLCLGLAACGSSSSTKTNTSTNAANTSSTPSGAAAGRFAAMRACLRRNGVTLPARSARTPGQGPGPLGGAGGGAQKLPNGVTRAQLQAALKKCGGAAFAGGGRRINSPVYHNALNLYAACMKRNGTKLPTANTSGKGPVFNTTGIDTSSAKFKAAAAKCQGVLRSTFQHYRRARPGAEASGEAGGAS